MYTRLFLFMTLVLGFPFVANAKESAPHGSWVGLIELPDTKLPLTLHLSTAKKGMLGAITLPSEGISDQAVKVTIQKSEIILTLKMETGEIVLNGRITDREISGDAQLSGSSGIFHLRKIFEMEPSQLKRYYGLYQFAKDRFVYIRTWDELGPNQLTYFDSTGRIGALHAESAEQMFSGPQIFFALPPKVTLRFKEEEITWSEDDQPDQKGIRLHTYREEEVSIPGGDAKLSGTLFLPFSKGPHPALILVHGSSQVTRDFFGPIAYHFVRQNIAVLAYDKRGSGKSGGDFLDADLSGLASDVVAAVQVLKGRKEINPKAIGLWGISQGGWVAPLAASISKDVAFLILVSTPAVTPAEQEIMALEEELKVQKIPAETIANQTEKLRADIASLREDSVQQEIKKQLAQLQQEKKTDLLSKYSAENPRFLLWYSRLIDFDPIPVLQKTTCPVLAIFGEFDRTVPPAKNKEPLENALKAAQNADFTIRIFPKGNHALMESITGGKKEFPHLNRFVPGFLELMADWIRERFQ